jgi:tetratricopeptide (TPR) repeat protein
VSEDEFPEDEIWERTTSEDPGIRADALIDLGHLKIQQENFALAKSLFGSATDVCQELDREFDLARAVYSVGYCQFKLGEFADAAKSLEDALERHQNIGSARSIAFTASTLADSYLQLGDADSALRNYEIAVDAFVEIEDEINGGVNCLSMGEIHGKSARQTRALECFIRAYNIFQSGGDAVGAARAKERMAAALIELGDYAQAIQHTKDALHTFEHMELDDRVAFTEYRLGRALVLDNKYVQALGHLRSSIDTFRLSKDWSSAALAEVQLANALRLMDPETPNGEAERLLVRTQAYFESAGEVSNALVVETIQAEKLADKGLLAAAATILSDVIERAEELDDEAFTRATRASLAEVLFKDGRLSEAKAVMEQINSADWGENKVELSRLADLKQLLLETMALTLNIAVPGEKKAGLRVA